MNLCFIITLNNECVFFGLIVVLAADWVKTVALPVSFGSFSLHYLIVARNFSIVVLRVFVSNDIVLSWDVQSLIFVLFYWCTWIRTLLWWLEVMLLHVNI